MQYKMSYPQEQPVAKTTVKHPMKVHSQVKRRPPQQPFDPDDLTQRLLKVVADRKAYAERKRRERAESENAGRGSSPSKSQGLEKDGHLQTATGPSGGKIVKEKSVNTKLARPATSHGEMFRSKSSKEEPQRRRPKHGIPNPNSKAGHGASDSYHHVPQVAASQFVRTTKAELAEEKGLVHKLSKRAMKFHLHSSQADRSSVVPDPKIGPDQHLKVLGKTQSNRDRKQEQSQRQSQVPDVAVEDCDESELRVQHRHTLEGQLRPRASNKAQGMVRRKSTGDLLANQDGRRRSMVMAMLESHIAVPCEEQSTADGAPDMIHEPRVDWTQSDETQRKPRPKIAPLLRKADSIWIFRGRLGSFGKNNRDERVSNQRDMSASSTATETSKSPKAGFFARFKR